MYMERSYVKTNLRKCISYRDIRKNIELHDENKRMDVSTKAALLVNDPDVFNSLFKVIRVKSEDVYIVQNIESDLILKLLSRNIKSCYRIAVKSRDNIVQNLISFVRESSSYHVHRFDIKSFYENIDREFIINKLQRDGLLSKTSISLLQLYFKELDNELIKGLPMGVGLSSILSELTLQDFDNDVKNIDGVYLYERFVDDIILITDCDNSAKRSYSKLLSLLPKGLEFHGTSTSKRSFDTVSKVKNDDDTKAKEITFNFLGYKFFITEKNHDSDNFLKIKRRGVGIDISDDKVIKLKNRIIKSFVSYINSSDTRYEHYSLLIKRLKFLSGNYYLNNTSREKNVKSGIYYNYRFINQDSQLEVLDRFLISLLFSKRSKLSLRIRQKININHRLNLASFSFVVGHSEKKFHQFTYFDYVKIKRVWR